MLFAREDIIALLKSHRGLEFSREPCDSARADCAICFFFSARYFKQSILFPDHPGGDDDFKVLRKVFSWLGRSRLTCRVTGDLVTNEPLKVQRWDGWWPLKNKFLTLSVNHSKLVSPSVRRVLIRSEHFLAHEIACRPVITDLKLEGTYAMVREWLVECDDRHEDCFRNMPSPKLPPTHLINVNVSGTTGDTVILEKVDLFAPFPKYAALSYVWGASQPYMTTVQNYPSYRKGLPVASLGKCLQDAIWVARKLGLSFLWIDALCIIQDSGDDKIREIARMDSIYSFAYVTISASHIFSCMQSFLSTSPRQCIHRFSGVEVPFQSINTKVHLRVLDRKDDGYNNEWREDNEPIHTRAWTFQEHFMSPRMLLFKDFQLFWVCTKMRGRDGGWIAPDESQSYGQQWNLSRRNLQSPMLGDWQNICEMYSTRKLSDPNDKLTALSSVASYFAAAGSKSYAAGIWMTQYIDQLAWISRSHPGAVFAAKKRPDVWRAPSWSWASLDSNIAFRSQLFEKRVIVPYLQPQVVEWRVEPVSQAARFGQLKSAFLKIRGRLLKSRPEAKGDKYELSTIESTEHPRHVPDLGPGLLSFDLMMKASPPVVSTIEGIEPCDDFVYCLLLAILVSSDVAATLPDNIMGIQDDKVEEVFCLALRQRSDGSFYRVGYFVVIPKDRSKGWITAFGQAEERTVTLV
jgi:hypothetical protein